MKPQFTIIVRDNDKKENVLEFDVPTLNYSLSANPKPIYSGFHAIGWEDNGMASLKLEAEVLLSQSALEPKTYDLDEEVTEEIMDCRHGHDWTLSIGFLETHEFCQKCGIKRDEM